MRGIVLILGVLVMLNFLACSIGSAPHNAVDSVPLGSSITDLDRLYPRGAGSYGEVEAWTSVPTETKGKNLITNEFGTCRKSAKFDYDNWPGSRERFSGKITFFHHSFTSSDVNELIYVDGKLKEKGWGFLPG